MGMGVARVAPPPFAIEVVAAASSELETVALEATDTAAPEAAEPGSVAAAVASVALPSRAEARPDGGMFSHGEFAFMGVFQAVTGEEMRRG